MATARNAAASRKRTAAARAAAAATERPARHAGKTAAKAAAKKTAPKLRSRLLDARPDTADFRDSMFEPTLVEVPSHKPLSEHLKLRLPILDQGDEGACTAFGLAA
ncbi:hypothetical protein AB4084_02505, partial [Lysobacter sp. 2RAB21]